MKYDAITRSGIEIVERVPIPEELIPIDARVEMDAKKAAGYFTPRRAADGGGFDPDGRAVAGEILAPRSVSFFALPLTGGNAAACDRGLSDQGPRIFPLPRTEFVLATANLPSLRRRRSRARAIGSWSSESTGSSIISPSISTGCRQTADYVVETMRAAYPELEIPFHSRWRHFEAGKIDRWGGLVEAAGITDPLVFGRAAYDLAIVSVLLDAGAGPDWHYDEAASGEPFARSEGLGVASFAMFASGLFSNDPADPLRADAAALAVLTPEELGEGFQVSADQSDRRHRGAGGSAQCARPRRRRPAGHLRRGRGAARRPVRRRAGQGRRRQGLGADDAGSGARRARADLAEPDRRSTAWRSAIRGAMTSSSPTMRPISLVPFHKLSQWLTYSLIEPLIWTGVEVVDH